MANTIVESAEHITDKVNVARAVVADSDTATGPERANQTHVVLLPDSGAPTGDRAHTIQQCLPDHNESGHNDGDVDVNEESKQPTKPWPRRVNLAAPVNEFAV